MTALQGFLKVTEYKWLLEVSKLVILVEKKFLHYI